jgi:hypothetical protein
LSRRKGKSKREPKTRPQQDRPGNDAPSFGAVIKITSPADPVDGPSRVRVWPLAIALVLQALIILLFYSLAGSNAPPPRLLAFDALALPGEEIQLEILIDQDLPPFLSTDDEAYEVTIEGATPEALSKTTSPNKALFVSIRAPDEPGIVELVVRAKATDNDAVELEKKVILQVIPADAKIVISTIRHTLWSPLLAAAADSGSLPRARPRASAALDKLAGDHSVIYVEFIARRDLPWIGDWLEKNAFPAGAVLFLRDYDPRHPDTREPRLVRLLSERINDRWKDRAWAFGSDTEETESFANAGFKTVHIGAVGLDSGGSSGGSSGKAKRVVPAQSWAAVDDIIK